LARKKKLGIADWRDRIDAIDDRLLVLLNQRAKCSIEIGWIKRAHDLEIYVPAREVQILRRMSRANRGPLREESVRRLFERIIDESRATERVVCSSPESVAPAPQVVKKRVAKRGAEPGRENVPTRKNAPTRNLRKK
jgi:chorismate mutase